MISGLVVHFSEDESLTNAALIEIKAKANIDIGIQSERCLPIVVETDSIESSHKMTDWLFELEGVSHVDVTYVHLDE
ncbi:MAG: hypothetical protein COA78_06285 [Blastopirellula sp.]|nr:MAG: hypothetical protein COA78_06285 [Blastopirellula sp.]